jgi:hypothetical protein
LGLKPFSKASRTIANLQNVAKGQLAGVYQLADVREIGFLSL